MKMNQLKNKKNELIRIDFFDEKKRKIVPITIDNRDYEDKDAVGLGLIVIEAIRTINKALN